MTPVPVNTLPAPSSTPQDITEPSLPAPSESNTPNTLSPAPSSSTPTEKKPAGEWTPTENPKSTVVPGQMRSDREEIPEGFTKEDADKAETMEARIAMARVAPGCQVYWPAPYEVCGMIRDKYNELGGPNSFLLWPTTNELTNPDGYGKRTVFQNGPIYWSPAAGAHPVVNHFFAAWQRNGWEAGVLGYPTSDEVVNPDGGRRQYFQGGTVYWKLNEAYFVAGAIRDKWGETGWETGPLGYPQSDETILPDGVGRMNRFTGGLIYWSPSTGAHPVSGGIRDQWAQAGYETGPYGYPTSDEVPRAGIAADQQFQGGTIYWPQKASADVIHSDYMSDTGQAQCDVPLQQRTGAWACQGAPSIPSAAPPDQQRSGGVEFYCDSNFGGCWRQYDEFRADYEVAVAFGRGPEIIGHGSGYVLWQLEGPTTRIPNSWLKSDDAVLSAVWFSGALQNGAVGVANGGSVIHKAQPQQALGPHPLGTTVKPPQPELLALADRRMDDHNYAFQISAEFSEWPGYWYFWVRSPVSHYDDDDPDDIYRFQGADQLPGNPVDADWNW